MLVQKIGLNHLSLFLFLYLTAAAMGTVRAGDPDLVVDQPTLASSWTLQERYFPPGDCAVVEGCVDGSGARKLLRFSTVTGNIAQYDLYLGDPVGNPLFEFSPCHGHYHFEGYADYTLLDLGGNPAAPGHKQAFCLLDTRIYVSAPWVPTARRYTCSDQGIQRGWADVYSSSLDCQWIDVTDVPYGNYTLQVTVNPDLVLVESDYTNNTSTAAVTLQSPPGVPHRPDGRIVPGAQMRASRAGAAIRVDYDVTFCPASDYHVRYGLAHAVSSYTYDGAWCSLGTSGSALVSLPDPAPGQLLWFTVVGVSASGSQEGGHGFDSAGRERPLSGIGSCSVTSRRSRLTCS